MAITGVSGLASNIDTQAIVDAMMEQARRSTVLLENKKSSLELQLEAVRNLNTKLVSVDLDLAVLKRSDTYSSRTATVSSTALTATTSTSAITGTYNFNVEQLARAHQLGSARQLSSATNLVSTAGTLKIQVGSNAEQNISFTAGSSSLTAIAAEINQRALGATASVVNDGSGYRLVLKSDKTGTANDITISGTDDLANLFTVGADPEDAKVLAVAQDARITMGSSDGGGTPLSITSASNTFTDVIAGVTLTAQSVANDITVTVGTDTSKAKEAITTFSESYNTALEYFRTNASYDATTGTSGVLFSASDVRLGLSSISRAMLDVVKGLPTDRNTLGSLGITINRNTGALEIDEDALDAALADDPDGIAELFSTKGTSDDNRVSIAVLNDDIEDGTPLSVVITRAAEQAKASTSADLDVSTTFAAGDRTLSLSINGNSYSVALTGETAFTRSELASHLQSAINAVASPSDQVVVALDGDRLDLRTMGYGSSRNLSIAAGTVATQLKLNLGISYGVNVAGTINGEAATGTGQSLVGASGTSVEGLALVVTADEAFSTTITPRKGIAQRTSEAIRRMTDSVNGNLNTKDDSITSQIEDIDNQVIKADERLALRRKNLEAQFLAMEKLIQSLKSQGDQLASQISAMSNLYGSKNK